MSKKNEKFYDVRVSERYIKEGVISKKQYEDHIKGLSDAEDKSEVLVIEEGTEEEGTEEENAEVDEDDGKETE